MANKKIQIEIDVNDEEVKFASDSVLNFKQQIKLLNVELQKLSSEGKEGSKEFEILKNKLNETKDNAERVSAKSKELFGTLQLLPGPIGDISSKLDGGISLLKTFSSFTFKDISGSVSALMKDFGGIADNIGKATGITKLYSTINNALSKSFVAIGVGETTAAAGARAFSAALVATGIGALVVGLGLAVNAFMDFIDVEGKAKIETDKLNDSLAYQNTVLDMNAKDAKRRQNLTLAEMKANGATEKQIRTQQLKNAQDDYNNAFAAREESAKIYNAGIKKANKEGVEAAQKDLDAKDQALKDALNNGRILRLNNDLADKKERETANKEAQQLAKQNAEKQKQIDAELLAQKKADLDAQIKLETDKEDTSRENLKLLLDKRMILELDNDKLSNAQKDVIREDYSKKLDDAIKADDDKKRAKRIADLDAAIALETQSANTSLENLKSLLDQRMQEELSVADLTNNQKLEIEAKYAKMLNDAIKSDNEKRKADTFKALEDELISADGNFEAQLQAYQNYENALTTLVGVSEKERADKRKAYSDAILKTITDTLAAENVETEKSYGDFKRFDADYYAAKRASLDQAQKDLETSFQKGSITEAEYTKNKAAFGNASIEIDKAQAASKREEVALVGNALGQLSEIIGKDTVAGKAFAIAKATIDTYQSAVAAYKSLAGIPIVGPILGGIAAAAAVATGIATVKKIVAVQVPAAPASGKVDTASSSSSSAASGPIAVRGFAEGGYVSGQGSETSDSIPSMLSNGEFVMNASSTKLFRPLLSSMNSYGNQPKAKFAMGGPVSNTQPSGNSNLTDIIGNALSNNPIQTYVVANTMSNQQQLDRVIKSRSLI